MKKIMILVLSAVLLLSMTACACTGDQAASGSTPVPSPTEAPDPINTAALADIMTAILKDAPIEMVTGESAIEEERFSWVSPVSWHFSEISFRWGIICSRALQWNWALPGTGILLEGYSYSSWHADGLSSCSTSCPTG